MNNTLINLWQKRFHTAKVIMEGVSMQMLDSVKGKVNHHNFKETAQTYYPSIRTWSLARGQSWTFFRIDSQVKGQFI